MRPSQEPLASMVISGAGPNSLLVLSSASNKTGFPDPDRFDHLPIQVVAFSHVYTDVRLRCAALVRASCCNPHRRISIILLFRKHRPYGARHLVGQRDGDHHAGFPGANPRQP